MSACCQLEFPSTDIDAMLAEVRATGVLPEAALTEGLAAEDKARLCQAWMDGMSAQSERASEAYRRQFKARGWAFKWFSEWQPATSAERALSDAIDEAVEVVDRYYPAIFARGLDEAADMGLLQSDGRCKSEGVRVKRQPYSHNSVLVTVNCVTGPTNVAHDGNAVSVEFEPGAKSHRFHLLYQELPSIERLAGDIAAWPLIGHPSNRDSSAHGWQSVWMSEGWTGNHDSRPRLHRPWDTMPAAPRLAM